MRKHTLAGLCAAGIAALVGTGCDNTPHAAGEGGSPPAENSKVDENATKRPAMQPPPAPGETPKGGGIVGPPKRGGAPR